MSNRVQGAKSKSTVISKMTFILFFLCAIERISIVFADVLPDAHISGLYPEQRVAQLIADNGRFQQTIEHADVFGGHTRANIDVVYRHERLWDVDRASVRVIAASPSSATLEV